MNCSSAGLDIVAKMVLQGSSLSSCFCSRLVILGCLLCSLTFSSSSDESALLSDSVGSLVVFSTSRLRCGLVRYARWELWCFGPKPMGSDPSLCLDTLTMLLSSSSINVAIASKWRFCAVAVVVALLCILVLSEVVPRKKRLPLLPMPFAFAFQQNVGAGVRRRLVVSQEHGANGGLSVLVSVLPTLQVDVVIQSARDGVHPWRFRLWPYCLRWSGLVP